MTDLDLCYLPATTALAMFKARTLSPVELMQAVIARVEAVEPKINALTYRYFDEAMDQAKTAEARYARGSRTRALEGLPIGIKDESYLKGKPTSGGSLIQKDQVFDTTSPINGRILQAGGIVHARTATPEYSCATFTWSRLWGVTRNPWNPAFTPGGSSGGAAASLASGTSTLCTGSDIGGSIRIPAGATGLVGYKPPYGRNPDDPPSNLDYYCHTGPLARSVADTILLQNVCAGPHPLDIASLRPKLTLPATYAPAKGMRIAWSMDLGSFEVDAEVRRNTLAALDVFRALGAEVTEVDLGWGPEVLAAGTTHLRHIFGAMLARMLPDHADQMTTYTRAFAEDGAASSATDFVETMEVANRMYHSFGPLMERYDVFICPTNALAAVPADYDHSRDRLTINGRDIENRFLGWVMTSPFNTLSRCPVLSVPSGHAANGVPTGIQIVGRSYSDASVFRAAMAFEQATGGWYRSASTRPTI